MQSKWIGKWKGFRSSATRCLSFPWVVAPPGEKHYHPIDSMMWLGELDKQLQNEYHCYLIRINLRLSSELMLNDWALNRPSNWLKENVCNSQTWPNSSLQLTSTILSPSSISRFGLVYEFHHKERLSLSVIHRGELTPQIELGTVIEPEIYGSWRWQTDFLIHCPKWFTWFVLNHRLQPSTPTTPSEWGNPERNGFVMYEQSPDMGPFPWEHYYEKWSLCSHRGKSLRTNGLCVLYGFWDCLRRCFSCAEQTTWANKNLRREDWRSAWWALFRANVELPSWK